MYTIILYMHIMRGVYCTECGNNISDILIPIIKDYMHISVCPTCFNKLIPREH